MSVISMLVGRLFDKRSDPIEFDLRERVRGSIETELEATLARLRYGGIWSSAND